MMTIIERKSFCFSFTMKLVKAIIQDMTPIGNGVKFINNIASSGSPSPPLKNETMNETLVPYHPEQKRIHANPT